MKSMLFMLPTIPATYEERERLRPIGRNNERTQRMLDQVRAAARHEQRAEVRSVNRFPTAAGLASSQRSSPKDKKPETAAAEQPEEKEKPESNKKPKAKKVVQETISEVKVEVVQQLSVQPKKQKPSFDSKNERLRASGVRTNGFSFSQALLDDNSESESEDN